MNGRKRDENKRDVNEKERAGSEEVNEMKVARRQKE